MKTYGSNDTGLSCPKCGEKESVQVREHDTYMDGSDYEGYCTVCHAELVVYASVSVEFIEAEVHCP